MKVLRKWREASKQQLVEYLVQTEAGAPGIYLTVQRAREAVEEVRRKGVLGRGWVESGWALTEAHELSNMLLQR